MLQRTDRLALVVADADEATSTFASIFDTEVVGDEHDALTQARRVTLAWGRDLVELQEPAGDGSAASFVATRTGVYAGGFSCPDPAAAAARLAERAVTVHEQDADRYVVLPEDLDGTGVILTRTEDRPRVGLNYKIWQITYAVPGLEDAIVRYSNLFGIGDMFTNRYPSPEFGYLGAITWFDARDGGVLDSLEYLEPNDPSKAVARFVARNGNGIYMASIETDDIPAIKQRVEAGGPGWQGTDFGGFIHPKRLHGLLLGHVTYENWNARRPLPS